MSSVTLEQRERLLTMQYATTRVIAEAATIDAVGLKFSARLWQPSVASWPNPPRFVPVAQNERVSGFRAAPLSAVVTEKP